MMPLIALLLVLAPVLMMMLGLGSSAAAEPVCAIFANCRNHGMNNKHPRTTGAGGWGAVRLNFGCFIWLAFRTF